jgi:hypothetical protein
MLHRGALASRDMSGKLQDVFQAVISVVKKSPSRRRRFTKLCDDMEKEHAAFVCYCETYCAVLPKCFTGYLNCKIKQ